jgi:hypothetical protein
MAGTLRGWKTVLVPTKIFQFLDLAFRVVLFKGQQNVETQQWFQWILS